jgi:Ca-activated chloride channel family protein
MIIPFRVENIHFRSIQKYPPAHGKKIIEIRLNVVLVRVNEKEESKAEIEESMVKAAVEGGVTGGVLGGVVRKTIWPMSREAAAPPPSYYHPFNTEEYDRIYENQYLLALANPLSTFSIDVDTASYA